ncbi:hypothetical protein LNI91_04280 [Tenacibaculum dicentrarchi]|nr:hypothetical protein [Tenacibaculum dicentrarchi]
MWKLFNTSADKAGFRLQYMEIYNWGTFDNQIFKIEPKGNNSLLTGANGSGKTTFIDALLTLLVPLKSDRFYNQSSGVQKKGDRSEESYVLGHYGDIQKEGDLSTTSQKLRDKTTYSVLLASFSNTDEKIITLFQVRSFSNGMMKRTFGIAYKTLNITSEFSDFDAKGSWKKRLDKRHNTSQKKWIEYYDSPKKYAERLYKQFGMLSIKALSLFNKTVGIKALGDLDEFIKTNMLEKRDTENEYNQLKSSFTTLINTKNDIDKATEQIKQLEPINSIANQLKNINIQLEKTQENKEKSVFWFAQKGLNKVKALQEQLKNTQNNLAKTEKEIDTQKDAKRNENTKLNEAKAQITSHSTLLNKVSENKPDVIDLINLEENNVILKEINYTNFSVTQKTFQKNISDQNEKLNKDKNNLNIKVSSKINAFKNPSEEILKKYKSWHADVNQLSISLEFISEYQKKYNNLIKEDLPSFESKFNKHLQTTIEDKVGNFKFFFNQWSEDIKENISSLNNSLKAIDFNNHPTTTYIQLKAQNKKTADITEFKALLENAIPNFKEFDKSIDARKNHFNNNIKPFIKQLENEKWREKTMDVRSWFEYNAEEINRETNHRIKTYTGMGQLSGGEKAQLTYTILASAIAYQFGLTKEGNSFRFIAIDEAFKAQDEEKAKYLINLCKQLHLQLLVVTPSDNIHIVENDISFVHYIERRDNKISWLYDMPIEKFQEEKLKYIAK